MENKQVNSKKRVRDHGEVFTNHREVVNMLDLVKNETLRLDSRFLEPACGNGNFLVEILSRKLDVLVKKYGKNKLDFEKYSIITLGSIYGIDILTDNVSDSRGRLYKLWLEMYKTIFNDAPSPSLISSVKFVLKKNIILGDALTMCEINGKPLIVSEWVLIKGSYIQRSDYSFSDLLNPPIKINAIDGGVLKYGSRRINNSQGIPRFLSKTITPYNNICD